jgi:hypothetical protein
VQLIQKGAFAFNKQLQGHALLLQLPHEGGWRLVELGLHALPVLGDQRRIHLVCFCPLELGLGKALDLQGGTTDTLIPFSYKAMASCRL